jgi:hypothetical protein
VLNDDEIRDVWEAVREREETREFGQFVDRGVPVMIAASSV